MPYHPWPEEKNPPPASERQQHIIQPGESLSTIARMYGIPASLLVHSNGILDPEKILAGQILYIPYEQYTAGTLLPTELTATGLESDPNPTATMEPVPTLPPSTNIPEPPLDTSAVTRLESKSGQNFNDRPYAYFGNSEPAVDVLKNFASNYNIPVVLSEQINSVVNGRIGPLPAVDFLDKMAQLHALIWYFDGNTLYIYNSDEIQKQIINLQFLDTEQFRKTLMEIGIWDSRFSWRARPEEGIIYISGPPRYMELVTETALLLDQKSGERQKSQLTVKIFPLRYAWADDRTFNYRNQDVIIPGVASTLRQIVQGGGIQAHSAATPDNARSMPGLEPSTPAGQPKSPSAQANVNAERVFINADRRLNAVIIHDLESKMSMYESLINTLDKPLAQVEINVSIIDIDTDSLEQLGVNWQLGRDDGDYIRFNPFGANGDAANNFSTIINITSGKLLAQINMLSERNNAKILARPSVLTLDNMEAVLDNSQTFYVKVSGTESAELFPVTYGSVLKVTPRIVDEESGRKLHMSVNIQDGGQAGEDVENIPVVKNSSISTQAVIDENESLLVGGYYYEENRQGQSKVPLLGDIPIVGTAFKSKSTDNKKTVRLFLITPRIVDLM